ncbi:ribonuclease domain-containing protein, partial [Rothia sp. P5764]|uniref:ribonuclease domain-containing protein n=2 Tax=unclassified Rothia (in: high G+C Gram-positive bacteria) TaxID=2689056 RepID=UPI003AC92CC4
KKLVGGGIETLERGALKSASKDASGIAGGGASSANPRIGELSPVPEPQFVQPIGPVEAKAHQVLDTIDQKGVAPSGFKGGKIWENNGKGAVLPSGKNEPISYREWDVDPKVKGIPRTADRLVTGSDGSAYYTTNHYKSFIMMRQGTSNGG